MTMAAVPLYDDLGADYDRFVDWGSRLALELPAIEKVLGQAEARSLLDAACGTGRHAIALARRGYRVVGADLSAAMVERARQNAQAEGVEVPFFQAGLGELSRHLAGPFDAVLCLGHSLPHLLSAAEVEAALHDFASLLRPDGLLLIQNRNDERLLRQGQRFLPLSTCREGDQEWLFFRFLDLDPQRIAFHLVTFHREKGEWRYRVSSTIHRPLPREEMETALHRAGFDEISCYGSWQLEPFDPERSGDLVVVARRSE